MRACTGEGSQRPQSLLRENPVPLAPDPDGSEVSTLAWAAMAGTRL